MEINNYNAIISNINSLPGHKYCRHYDFFLENESNQLKNKQVH